MTNREFLFKEGKITNTPDFILLGCRQDEETAILTLHDHERSAHMYACGITGSGKSRFLENMIVQDISLGHPMCVIDPTGHLFRQVVDYLACCLDHAKHKLGFNQDDVDTTLEDYLFLDIDDPSYPLKLNPLEPVGEETTEEVVDDLLKVVERLFGSVDEMRRIRQTLRNALWVIVEINRLPEKHPPPSLNHSLPLNLHFIADFLCADEALRQQWINAVPDTGDNRYVLIFWRQFFSQYTPSQRMERLESTFNILQYFLNDSLVNRFFDTSKSTFQISDLMRRKRSLFCHLPLGKNLKGSQLIGTFLATKFQRVAYRRTPEEREHPYYLYIDEFHEFADIEFAKASATLRQYNLRMVNAHQSQTQPPFHTAEGQSILNTIKGNSLVKVLFRLTRNDAETMSRETFELTQRKINFRTTERMVATAQGNTMSQTVSFQLARGYSESWSRGFTRGLAKSTTLAMGLSNGTNIGKTITKGIGTSIAKGLSKTITLSESEGIIETHSKTHGISVAMGKNFSHMVDHRRGISFTHGNGESFAVSRGHVHAHAEGNQQASSQSSGSSYAVSDGHGNSFVNTEGESLAFLHAGSQGSSRTGSSVSEMVNTTNTATNTFSAGTSQIRSVADTYAKNYSETNTRSRNASRSDDDSTGVSQTHGKSEVQTANESETVSEARKHDWGRSESHGQTRTFSRNEEQSLSNAFTLLEQVSKNLSRALQETASRTATYSGSVQETVTEGEAVATARSSTDSTSISEKKVFFTLEGERELLINRLQKLPRRHCIVTKEALGAMEIETLHVPDYYYFYRGERLPEEIIERQRKRYGLPESTSEKINLQAQRLPYVDKEEPEEIEDWFPDW